MTNRHPNSERENDRRDFWLGVLGFALGNALLLLLQSPGPLVTLMNLAAWVLLAAVRPRAALGTVTALATFFAAGLLATAFLFVSCVTVAASVVNPIFGLFLGIPILIVTWRIFRHVGRSWDQATSDDEQSETPRRRLSPIELQSVRSGLRRNLVGYDLSKLDLSDEYLEGVNLSHADLHMADLENADLTKTKLRHAILTEAYLVRANLSGADLREANLRDADLRRADLRDADLRKANLRDADLRDANLQGANFTGAILSPLLDKHQRGLSREINVKETTMSDGKSHPRQREFALEQSVRLTYLLFLPQGYASSPSKKWPLILFLHGVGERGDDIELVKLHGIPKIIEQHPDFPFIAISPQCPDETLWWDYHRMLKAILDQNIEQYEVDTNRIYLTGLSMGGYGVWSLGMTYPDQFAALAPICGGGMAGMVPFIQNVPVWAFHGEQDPVVRLEEGQRMVDALRACGGDVRFTVYPGVGHDSWTQTYDNPELYKWFLQHTR